MARLDDNSAFNLYDYFDDYLDVEFRIDRYGHYKSVAVTVATGGPHIEVDTSDSRVKLWWGGDRAEYPITYEASDQIDEIFAEEYETLR